jgi:hypothetical protein
VTQMKWPPRNAGRFKRDWCETALKTPERRMKQGDGHWQHGIAISDTEDSKPRALRLVVLDDGETVHNAFFDRDYEGSAK